MEPDDTQVDNNNPEPHDSSTDQVVEDTTPDYQAILDAAPESLHGVLRPAIEQYAEGQASRYGELETRYKEYESERERWKDVLQYEPQVVQDAVAFSSYINENPVDGVKQLIQALQQQGLWEAEEQPPAQNQSVVDDSGDDYDDPAYKKLAGELAGMKELLTKFAETQEAEQRKSQEAAQQKQVDDYLNELALGAKFFDPKKDAHRNYVISQITRGVNGKAAVESLEAEIIAAAQALNQPAQDAPPVVGASSASPSNKISPGKMTPEQRAAYVAERLKADAEAAKQ